MATWREGDDQWRYRPDSFQHIHADKVSLDPYRLESRKSLALVKEFLPAPPIQKVEKASIDEVFLDLSAQIHEILLKRYPELRFAPYDDLTEFMPVPPTTALNWEADGLIDLDDGQSETQDPDWDDVVMNIGAEIVRDVRKEIRDKLKYTTSAGIARNKMMAKLGAGYKKPNQQTIVRNRAVQHFLSGFKFTKIRNLGGKLGDQIVETFGTDEVQELLQVPVERLKSKFGDDTGTWIHEVIRGSDSSEVSARTLIKSMLSAKSFRPSINSFDQAVKWLRIFVSDIFARLVEEGVVEGKRRPKTITLHHRQGGQMRSKQLPIPGGKTMNFDALFELAKALLQQIILDGHAFPCGNLSLSVGSFEDGVTSNRGIGSFLVRGDEAKALEASSRSITPLAASDEEDARPGKRRKLNGGPNIGRFFQSDSLGSLGDDSLRDEDEIGIEAGQLSNDDHAEEKPQPETLVSGTEKQTDIATYFCQDCKTNIPESDKSEHEDWHFAVQIQADDRASASVATTTRPSAPAVTSSKRVGAGKSQGRGGKSEKGQSRLNFG